ncbi:MAG TPA: dodecin [Gemmatimonadales bacterium]
MTDNVYKTIELYGSSKVGIEQAIQNALSKASGTIREMRWFEMVEVRGQIADGAVAVWQVGVKIGFTLDG